MRGDQYHDAQPNGALLVYGRILFTGTPEEVPTHPEVKAVYLGEGSG